MIYKFVKWDVPNLENYKNTTMYILHNKCENQLDLSREEKNKLVFSSSDPNYKLYGWAYDFREFLKEFWVETKYYGIVKVYAFDKTAIRESKKVMNIVKIVEAK